LHWACNSESNIEDSCYVDQGSGGGGVNEGILLGAMACMAAAEKAEDEVSTAEPVDGGKKGTANGDVPVKGPIVVPPPVSEEVGVTTEKVRVMIREVEVVMMGAECAIEAMKGAGDVAGDYTIVVVEGAVEMR
jgi:hypothetical protein